MAYGDWAQWKRRRHRKGHKGRGRAVYSVNWASATERDLDDWIARHGKKRGHTVTVKEVAEFAAQR